MGVFLYYLPRSNRMSPRDLADSPLAIPLRDVLASRELADTHVVQAEVLGRGPDGGQGVVIAALPHHGDCPQPLGYHRDRQSWHSQAGGAWWLGVDTEAPPRAWDLQRLEPLAGHPVRCGDESEEYTVPVIRRWTHRGGQPAVPQSIGVDGAGELQFRVRPAWRPAWEVSEEIWNLVTDPKIRTPWVRVLDLCQQMLGVNYRLGIPEMSLLGLVDTVNWEQILGGAVDMPTVARFLAADGGPAKNSDSGAGETSSSSPGSAAA